MTLKIAVWNLRGGSGKTTLAWGLALELLKRNITFGVVDLAPQKNFIFEGINILQEPDESMEVTIFDCPPYATQEVGDLLKISDAIVIPDQCEFLENFEPHYTKLCLARKTYLVPTWYKEGQETNNFNCDFFIKIEAKLKWSHPVDMASLSQVSEELANNIFKTGPRCTPSGTLGHEVILWNRRVQKN